MSASQLTDLYEVEEDHHRTFDEHQVNFTPAVVLTIKLLRCREVSISFFQDMVDTPDPQFQVSCPTIPDSLVLKTLNMKDDCPTCEINETFQFVIPDDLKDEDILPVVIQLYDTNYFFDKCLGEKTINAGSEVKLGTPTWKTVDFDGHGYLDVEIIKTKRTNPDFRYSVGMHPEEKLFRKRRLQVVFENMKKVLGHEKSPQSLKETPVVSLVTSGGGYRAAVGMCGVMEALNDAGLMDMFTYAAGLSGSAWYLMSAYALKGMLSEEQTEFHKGLRERFENNLFLDMVNPCTFSEYRAYLAKSKDKYKQPYSFVDYFPGFLVGKHMLGEKNIDTRLSDLKDYVHDGKVPLPIFASLHVKSNVRASKFHAYLEETPFEISLPEFAVGLPPDTVGSSWCGGFLAYRKPEMPLHFSQGMTGCAFSILLQTFINNGTENSSELSKFIESERINGRRRKENREVEIESDGSDTEFEDDEEPVTVLKEEERNVLRVKPERGWMDSMKTILTGTSFFTDRNAFVGRSAKLHNFVHGFHSLVRVPLNPLASQESHSCGQREELIEELGVQKPTIMMSVKKKTISIVDAGILFNTPTSIVLRPQRCLDLMIVMDFTAYESDDTFNYSTILCAAAHAWRAGLHFPPVDFEELTNLPPKEFLIFPSDHDDCPTVLWFTLSNKAFKNLNNYTPRSNERPSDGSKFNDFPVLSDGSAYSTFKFQYNKLDFDRLRELMYHNVTSHKEEIHAALQEAIERKRRRIMKH
ncbi:unnamed protein product [Clavelina lepadiformis]